MNKDKPQTNQYKKEMENKAKGLCIKCNNPSLPYALWCKKHVPKHVKNPGQHGKIHHALLQLTLNDWCAYTTTELAVRADCSQAHVSRNRRYYIGLLLKNEQNKSG